MMTERPRSLSSQRPSVPAAVDAAVMKALERLPADRHRSASEFAQALTASAPTGATIAPVAPARSKQRPTAVIVGRARGRGVGGRRRIEMLGHRGARAPDSPPSRLALLSMRLPGSGRGLAPSPDRDHARRHDNPICHHRHRRPWPHGATIAHRLSSDRDSWRPAMVRVAGGVAGRSIVPWIRERRPSAIPVPPCGGSSSEIGATRGRRRRISRIWTSEAPFGSSPNNGGGIYRLDPGDSVPRLIRHSEGMRLQQLLPDTRHALVMTQATMQTGPSAVFDIETGQKAPLLTDGGSRRCASRKGIWSHALPNGTLEAVPFDAATRRVSGSPVTVATNVSTTGAGIAEFRGRAERNDRLHPRGVAIARSRIEQRRGSDGDRPTTQLPRPTILA